jgi:hypothetical protein
MAVRFGCARAIGAPKKTEPSTAQREIVRSATSKLERGEATPTGRGKFDTSVLPRDPGRRRRSDSLS